MHHIYVHIVSDFISYPAMTGRWLRNVKLILYVSCRFVFKLDPINIQNTRLGFALFGCYIIRFYYIHETFSLLNDVIAVQPHRKAKPSANCLHDKSDICRLCKYSIQWHYLALNTKHIKLAGIFGCTSAVMCYALNGEALAITGPMCTTGAIKLTHYWRSGISRMLKQCDLVLLRHFCK